MQAKVKKTMNSVLGFVAGVSTVALLGTAMAQTPAVTATAEDMAKTSGRATESSEKRMGPDLFQKVDRTVEKIEKGIIVKMTSTDADTVKKLQERGERRDERHPEDAKIKLESNNIDNGVQHTITSDDAELVKKIQDSDGKPPRPFMNGMKNKMEKFNLKVDRKVEKTDKGVVMTMTSTDAGTVTKLQNGPERLEKKVPEDSKVQVTHENIDGGVKVTFSSDDAETVKKIQSHEEKPMFFMHKDHGNKGYGAKDATAVGLQR